MNNLNKNKKDIKRSLIISKSLSIPPRKPLYKVLPLQLAYCNKYLLIYFTFEFSAPKRKIEDTNQSNKNTKKVPLAQRPVTFVKSSDNQTENQKAKEDSAHIRAPKPPKQKKMAQNNNSTQNTSTLVARHETDQEHRSSSVLPLSMRPLAFVKSNEVLHLGKDPPDTPEGEVNEAEVEEAETKPTNEPVSSQNNQPWSINLAPNKYVIAVQNNSKLTSPKGSTSGREITQSGRGAIRYGPPFLG